MNIPVVTVHSYNAKPQKTDYTYHVINQSVFCGNQTYSITDYPSKVSKNLNNYINISFEELKTEDYILFMNNYVHMSSNHFNFERAAIGKFFLLKEFMEKYNFKKIFHIDSDVLLYKLVKDFCDYYEHYDFTLTNEQQCGNSFFTIEVIQDLCEKILKIYIDKEKYFWFNDLKNIFNQMQTLKLNGGVCDMTLLKHYKKRKECNSKFTCGEMTEVIENFRFDHHIRHLDTDYDFEEEKRKILFFNKIPYSFNKNLNKNINFYTLHFGGKAKEYLSDYITYNL